MASLKIENNQMTIAPEANDIFKFFGFNPNSCVEGVHFTSESSIKWEIFRQRGKLTVWWYKHTIVKY